MARFVLHSSDASGFIPLWHSADAVPIAITRTCRVTVPATPQACRRSPSPSRWRRAQARVGSEAGGSGGWRHLKHAAARSSVDIDYSDKAYSIPLPPRATHEVGEMTAKVSIRSTTPGG